jgi:hypothetical protein
MSTAAVSSSSIYQQSQAYFQARSSDLKQLSQALQSGDLAGAQKEFNAIQTLGQNGPFSSGNAFHASQRQLDFNAVGQALQNGNLAGAQQAFADLQSTFHNQRSVDPPATVVNLSGAAAPATAPTPVSGTPAQPVAAGSAGSGGGQEIILNFGNANPAQAAAGSSAGSSGGAEIVLNLGNVTPGEQITIGVSNSGNGAEQVTIGVANQQNQNPEQITLNLNQNSNQQIILNLLNSAASSTTSGTPPGSGVNVTA